MNIKLTSIIIMLCIIYGCASPKVRDFDNCWSHLTNMTQNTVTMCIDGPVAIMRIYYRNKGGRGTRESTTCKQVGDRTATDQDGIFQVRFERGSCMNGMPIEAIKLVCRESQSSQMICLDQNTQEQRKFER